MCVWIFPKLLERLQKPSWDWHNCPAQCSVLNNLWLECLINFNILVDITCNITFYYHSINSLSHWTWSFTAILSIESCFIVNLIISSKYLRKNKSFFPLESIYIYNCTQFYFLTIIGTIFMIFHTPSICHNSIDSILTKIIGITF